MPMKRGACAGRCHGEVGGMYDFLDIDIDPLTGTVWAALVDVCTDACDEPGANARTRQQSYGLVAHQIGGDTLLTEEIPERKGIVFS